MCFLESPQWPDGSHFTEAQRNKTLGNFSCGPVVKTPANAEGQGSGK